MHVTKAYSITTIIMKLFITSSADAIKNYKAREKTEGVEHSTMSVFFKLMTKQKQSVFLFQVLVTIRRERPMTTSAGGQ